MDPHNNIIIVVHFYLQSEQTPVLGHLNTSVCTRKTTNGTGALLACLALTEYVLSFITIMMHGMSLSIIAKGPCFNSPLKIPSECKYVNSLIF